ncbi:MAG: GNAT family N-acetyltransferase [Candidatus Bipolaricaulota bacterium]|nr:GNAT family N-acetyltransferase [Candidatus Bipolaricaulota bacterium]
MSMRPLDLSRDLVPGADVLVRSFQYPDHPEWGVQSDEQEKLVDFIHRMRGIWPIVRILQCVVPALRDLARGIVWEEGGTIGGLIIAEREGVTTAWYIETVGVLPEFRRRGIARQLVVAALGMMRSRGGTRVRLGVIDGNAPAQALYRSLGFVEYPGGTLYALTPSAAIDRPTLSTGYEELRLAAFDWRTRYELDKRIVPSALQDFEPIVPGRYRTPWFIRALAPLFRLVEPSRSRDIIVCRASDRLAVARAGWIVSKRGKGTSTIRIRLDPAHVDLAPYVVRRSLHEVLKRSPSLRVEIVVPMWMPDVARELETLGFVKRASSKSMGMRL